MMLLTVHDGVKLHNSNAFCVVTPFVVALLPLRIILFFVAANQLGLLDKLTSVL